LEKSKHRLRKSEAGDRVFLSGKIIIPENVQSDFRLGNDPMVAVPNSVPEQCGVRRMPIPLHQPLKGITTRVLWM
jgi:hypothetical protein